jgi:hypothetical protein
VTDRPIIDPAKCQKLYPDALRRARAAAFPLGYAVAVHGSETRDLDLVAVPWTEAAVDAETVALAIREATEGFLTPSTQEGQPWPRQKPHGRLCWSFQLGGGPYIDLSVMPRRSQPELDSE